MLIPCCSSWAGLRHPRTEHRRRCSPFSASMRGRSGKTASSDATLCSRQKISPARRQSQHPRPSRSMDKAGNPIEVAAVIAWRVSDTAKPPSRSKTTRPSSSSNESAVRAVASTRYYDGDARGGNSTAGRSRGGRRTPRPDHPGARGHRRAGSGRRSRSPTRPRPRNRQRHVAAPAGRR